MIDPLIFILDMLCYWTLGHLSEILTSPPIRGTKTTAIFFYFHVMLCLVWLSLSAGGLLERINSHVRRNLRLTPRYLFVLTDPLFFHVTLYSSTASTESPLLRRSRCQQYVGENFPRHGPTLIDKTYAARTHLLFFGFSFLKSVDVFA